MANLVTIASAKIHAYTLEASKQLDQNVLSLQRRNLAKGNFKSGATIKELIRVCSSSIISIQNEAVKQYKWVIEESLVINTSLQSNLELDAGKHLKSILEMSNTHLQKLLVAIDAQDLYPRTSNEIQKTYEQSLVSITLFLEGEFTSHPNKTIKKAIKFFSDLLLKLVGFFKPT